MSFEKRVNTPVIDIYLKNDIDYVLQVKVNSFKNNTIELEVSDNITDVVTELDFETYTYLMLKNKLGPVVTKYLDSNKIPFDIKILNGIALAALKSCLFASKMKGDNTLDYHVYGCQALVKISNIKK